MTILVEDVTSNRANKGPLILNPHAILASSRASPNYLREVTRPHSMGPYTGTPYIPTIYRPRLQNPLKKVWDRIKGPMKLPSETEADLRILEDVHLPNAVTPKAEKTPNPKPQTLFPSQNPKGRKP